MGNRFILGKVIDFKEAKKHYDWNKVKKADVEDDVILFDEMRPDSYVYAEIRALTEGKSNANGDCFLHEELIRIDESTGEPVYKSFVGKGLYKNHNSDAVENAVGVIIDAEYIVDDPSDRHVRLIVACDRLKDPDLARGLELGRYNNFSMGCSISYSICSHCGKKITDTKSGLCDCLKYHRGQKLQGKTVCEILHGVAFHEVSCVTVGADAKAKLISVLADRHDGKILKVASVDDFILIDKINEKIFNGNIKEKIALLNQINKI